MNTHNISDDLKNKLGYDPRELSRELNPYYIAADEKELNEMLESIGKKDMKELFSHIDDNVKFDKDMGLDAPLSYEALVNKVETTANKNNIPLNFLGDGLPQFKLNDIVPFVCNIRGLTTAYTPYQPERSQGTLHTLWIYSSAISQLTGFEAINASLYERSTCLYEAIKTAQRLDRKRNTVVICDSIYPQDKEVIETIRKETNTPVIYAPIHKESGLTDTDALRELIKENADICAIAFPQINGLGLIENCDELTDIAHEAGINSIAIIDPILLSKGGLKQPSKYGSNGEGVTMIVGEGQHICLEANFGGPGLGIFGIRFNDKNKTAIRSTAGRYVGKAIDSDGKECLAMVLSTREQHIRREKATSNICSNQSFVSTIAGAALLANGDSGLETALKTSRENTEYFLNAISNLDGVSLAFPTPFYNEVTLEITGDVKTLIDNDKNIVAGKDISNRYGISKNLIKVSFGDIQTREEIDQLVELFRSQYSTTEESFDLPMLPETFLREEAPGIPTIEMDKLKAFYTELGNLNVSPDDDIYPLGSCTMKYNPYINDWAAGLKNFTMAHPDMPEKYIQGTLEVIYEIQEDFKKITGLPGVTTQPVAGAQGELVGIKLFQAYHADKGNKKDIILIPRSAHGTNPATAAMAGFENKVVDGVKVGIVTLDADERGQINIDQLKEVIAKDGDRVAGIMITNPNTSGVFEVNFKEVADIIHSVDGLVYMDGANMNAIAGHIDLDKLGVDAVHNNLHKTWTIPHGGGGPGDAIVAVSEKLIDFLPGVQIAKDENGFRTFKTPKTIGDFHRHEGNFAHKVRAYTYIKALGEDGVKKMSEVAVLSARYLYERLNKTYPTLPLGADDTPRMHEFIITISDETFDRIAEAGTPKNQAIAKIGKLFLDFGLHAPTVAFPEVFGLMIEPTESFSKSELDRFADIVETISKMIVEVPEVLTTTPHFTPVKKVDEVWANKNLQFSEKLTGLATLPTEEVTPKMLRNKPVGEVVNLIVEAHKSLK
jgi:glycine dehydrogenase